MLFSVCFSSFNDFVTLPRQLEGFQPTGLWGYWVYIEYKHFTVDFDIKYELDVNFLHN